MREVFGDCRGFIKACRILFKEMDTTASTSGILRTLLWLLWLWKQPVRYYSRKWTSTVARHFEKSFVTICGFEERLLNGRQLLLAVCSLLHK